MILTYVRQYFKPIIRMKYSNVEDHSRTLKSMLHDTTLFPRSATRFSLLYTFLYYTSLTIPCKTVTMETVKTVTMETVGVNKSKVILGGLDKKELFSVTIEAITTPLVTVF